MTLYETIAGRLPFAGANAAALAGQRLAMPAPPLRAFTPEASPEIEAVLAKALSISPASRFPAAIEFSAGLRRVAQRPPPQGYVTRQGAGRCGPAHSRAHRRSASCPAQSNRPRDAYDHVPDLPPSGSGGISAAGMAAVLGIVIVAAVGGLVAALILTNQNSGSNAATSPTATIAPTQAATATQPPPTATAKATNAPTATPAPTATATPSSPSATATETRRATPTREANRFSRHPHRDSNDCRDIRGFANPVAGAITRRCRKEATTCALAFRWQVSMLNT